MSRTRTLSPALAAIALALGLALPAEAPAAGGDAPPSAPFDSRPQRAAPRNDAQGRALADPSGAPPGRATRAKVKNDKRSEWRDGYRVAVSLIQDGRYDEAIAKLTILDKPDSADVLNYIGYAQRKMSRMEAARVSYESALALSPGHRGVLEYYGEWHVEMGRIDEARLFLARLEAACGTGCREYRDLAEAIAARPAI